ncbi:MAG TPA: peptidyl-prolyl cis-trans isomerase [Candidatus Desulfaltia sp.]|nr:peptidyl-prolyl cis-trans isomerase [Candidatus Desulfaltia sp.]
MNRRNSRPVGHALAAAVITVAFLASSCGSKKQAGGTEASDRGTSADESRVVLQVGPDSYSLGDFSRYVRESVGGGETELNVISLSNLFDQFIEEKLILRAAADKGITISPGDKQAYLEETEEGVWTEEEKAALLAADSGPLVDGLKVEKYIREITRDITVGDDEVRRYYDNSPGEFSLPERVQVSQVLLPTESRAIEVWERARFSDEDGFRALARSESIGPEASEGGEMGIFQKGQLPADIEGAVFAMREGEVSPIVESSYGFHIFRLDKRFEPEQISFEDAAPAIRRKILDRKAEALRRRHLLELKESLEWRIFPENLSFPYQRMER